MTNFFLIMLRQLQVFYVGRPLWQEEGSVVKSSCWASPAQSFSSLSTAGLMTIFYCLILGIPQPGGPGFRIYFPQEQGGQIILPLRVYKPRGRKADHVEDTEVTKKLYWILLTNVKRKSLFAKHRLKWEDNIKMDIKGMVPDNVN
jgi:hypothetical protein